MYNNLREGVLNDIKELFKEYEESIKDRYLDEIDELRDNVRHYKETISGYQNEEEELRSQLDELELKVIKTKDVNDEYKVLLFKYIIDKYSLSELENKFDVQFIDYMHQ